MLYSLGRVLQLLGLLIVPYAIAGNLAQEQLSVKEMLVLSGVGVALFFLGWLLQQGTRPR